MAAINVVNVQKRYGSRTILAGTTFELAEGESYGLIGPNGAGKSTLFQILIGLIRPDGGEVTVLGQRPANARRHIGYLPENCRFFSHFTPQTYLQHVGALYQMCDQKLNDRCRSLLRSVGLSAVSDQPIKQLSKGRLQCLGLAQALLHTPRLLLLDEPSSGLDRQDQKQFVELLKQVRRQGHTMVLCSHHLAEVEHLCDRVGVLYQGRIAAEAPVDKLRSLISIKMLLAAPTLSSDTIAKVHIPGVTVQFAGSELLARGTYDFQADLLRILHQSGIGVERVFPTIQGVADFYMQAIRPFAPAASDALSERQ